MCEYIYGIIFKKEGSVISVGFSSGEVEDVVFIVVNKYLVDFIMNMCKGIVKCMVFLKKGLKGFFKVVKEGIIVVAFEFVGWRAVCLSILVELYDIKFKIFFFVLDILVKVKSSEFFVDVNFKNVMKMVMSFIKFKMDEVNVVGVLALNMKIIFDEMDVLKENIDFIKCVLSLLIFIICYIIGENVGLKVDDVTFGVLVFEFVVTFDEDFVVGVVNMFLG